MCDQDCLHFQHPGKVLQIETDTSFSVPAKYCGVLRVLIAEAVPCNTPRLPASAVSAVCSHRICLTGKALNKATSVCPGALG